jgi:hypothetical protein
MCPAFPLPLLNNLANKELQFSIKDEPEKRADLEQAVKKCGADGGRGWKLRRAV